MAEQAMEQAHDDVEDGTQGLLLQLACEARRLPEEGSSGRSQRQDAFSGEPSAAAPPVARCARSSGLMSPPAFVSPPHSALLLGPQPAPSAATTGAGHASAEDAATTQTHVHKQPAAPAGNKLALALLRKLAAGAVPQS